MGTIEHDLIILMTDILRFPEECWKLKIVTDISNEVGEVDDPEKVAGKIIEKLIDNFPPEINSLDYDSDEFGNYFFNLNNNLQKRLLLEAAKEFIPAKSN